MSLEHILLDVVHGMLSSASLSSSLESTIGMSLIFQRGALGCNLGSGASSSYSSSSLLCATATTATAIIATIGGGDTWLRMDSRFIAIHQACHLN